MVVALGKGVSIGSGLSLRADKAVDPVVAALANQLAPTRQVMQMGERFAQRKRQLVAVERSPEQHRQ